MPESQLGSQGDPIVRVRGTKVSTTSHGEGAILFHAPSGRLTKLDAVGMRLWSQIQDGGSSVGTLVESYCRIKSVNQIDGSHEVLSFLEILEEEGIIERLRPDGPRDSRQPFVDVQIDEQDALDFEALLDDSENERIALAERRLVRIEASRLSDSLGDIQAFAAKELDVGEDSIRRVIALDLDSREIQTSGYISKLVTHQLSEDSKTKRRFAEILSPSSELRLADVLAEQEVRLIGPARRPSARRVAGIIIVFDRVVIIVIIVSRPGPTFGKSRSACQTACV